MPVDSSEKPCRSDVFQVGPLQVFIESDTGTTISALEPLFSGFERRSQSAAALPIAVSSVDDRFQAVFEDRPVAAPSSMQQLQLALTRTLNRAVLDAEVDLLHLHAGAVHSDGVTVLVIGSSMAGKSTLVAKLVTEGWQYLSDEQVAVTAAGEIVRFPRAITLREQSWPLFAGALPDLASQSDRIEVSPTLLGEMYVGEPVVPDLIIRPDVSVQQSTVEPLTVAHALSVLIEDSLDLERAGEAGLNAMLEITSAAPAFWLAGQDLEQTVSKIGELCQSATAPGEVTAHGCVADDEPSDRVGGSLSWLFADGSGALFEPVSGMLVRLDGAGYRAWQQLGDPGDRWPTGLADSRFVADLRDAGLLLNSHGPRSD